MPVQRGSVEHWIAVQKPLLEFLPKEVKPGQALNAYMVLIGTVHKVDEEREWLFAMNEFDPPWNPGNTALRVGYRQGHESDPGAWGF